MSEKKKTDFLKLFIGAALAAASVLLIWLFGENRFSNIPIIMIFAVIAALIAETAVLMLLKSKILFIRIIKIIIVFIINVSVFTSAVIYSFAPAVILQPHTDESAYNSLKENSEVTEITFEGKNGEINGWFYERAGDNAPIAVYFYGNYETASGAMRRFAVNDTASFFDGYNLAVFDYPAYGNSEGSCSDKSLLDFALDVYDKLSEMTDAVLVLGYSVGTGPATYLASLRDVKGLILYAPYYDGADLYNNVIDVFHGPFKHLVAFNIESGSYAVNVKSPVLIIASEDDELIPYESSLRLYEKFDECSFVSLKGVGHNDFWTNDTVKEQTYKFTQEVIS